MRRPLARLVVLVLVLPLATAAGCQPGTLDRGTPAGGGDGGSTIPTPPIGPTADAGPIVREVPLDPAADNSSGVKLDPAGDLILDVNAPAVLHSFIWIANSPEGTVSKIDTETGVEVARYRSGPGSPDPSRTTVGLDGDVVVANRGGSSAVRIHAALDSCPDTNGNGVVETSTGPADVLPWGSDECVLWYHEFPAGSTARAAAFDFLAGPDGDLSSSVWIGLYHANKLVRLSAETGDVISEVDITGHCPYGMAFDGHGDLWAFSACSGVLVHLDTATLGWETIALPGGCAYGITTDADGNVWTSGGSCVGRYSPSTGTWATASVGSSNRGLAVDGAGSVWVADTSYGVHRLDAASLTVQANLPLPGAFVGMAVDFHGKVWAVSQGTSQALRIDPATLAHSAFPTGANPYTYSDMTGFQLQNAAPPIGLYRAVLEGCGPETLWLDLFWEAITPTGTFVRFGARTGNTLEELAARPFVPIARQPGDVSPADLRAALEAAAPAGSYGHLLELEIALGSETADLTPTLESVQVTTNCAEGTVD